MSLRCLISAIALVTLGGCGALPSASLTADARATATVHLPAGTEPWAAPPINRAVTVLDGRTGDVLSLDQMLDRLAAADAVFLGESHIDETTHRVELAVYEGLLGRRDDAVVLAMEMFERDVQPALDDYLADRITESEFLERARPWGQYRSAYRPLIERARADDLPVVASNFPRPLTRRVAMEGLGVLDTLGADERREAPAEIFPNTPDYWRRVDNAVRGHVSMMPRSGGDDQRLTSTQTLWDNAMGESCALALEAHPGSMVLHVNGGFHSAFWDGSVHQLKLRRPDARVLTVDIRSTRNPSVATIEGEPVADFVVMAEARAMDENEGTYAVALDRELDYRFKLPAGATDDKPVPLLIWLGDAGLLSQDGMDLWQDRLGADAAIAVLEPPYRALFDDLSEGGRWYWPDSAAEDIGSLVGATERVWAYLLRHYPIDPARVCVAGEGTGATVVAAIALLGDRMDHKAVAFEPAQYAKLKDFPLPLLGESEQPSRAVSLTVSGSVADESWWNDELAAYRGVGLETSFSMVADPALARDAREAASLRAALGLPANELAQGAAPVSMTIPTDTARARHWARLYAQRFTAATGRPVTLLDPDASAGGDGAIALDGVVHPSTIGDAIPRCPGPFGGTTVLVLPEGLPSADVKTWVALEENDPLNKTSRFHRLRIAMADSGAGDRSLPNILTKLEGENRKNVLIVPAVFCADPGLMRSMERQTRGLANRMTIQWLPGLGGGELPIAAATATGKVGTVGHELHVVLDPAKHHLSVGDTISLPPGARRAGAEFTLSSALEITGSEPGVEKLGIVENADGPRLARYALASDAPDGMLRLSYEGDIDFGLSDQKEEYARGFRETHGILGPEGVYLDGGSAWVASFGSEMIRFTLEVQGPGDWHVISQGNGSSEAAEGPGDTRIARWDSGSELEQVYLVGGPLQVEHEMAGAVDVLVYLHDWDEALARKYLDATARYIEMYRKLIGPYPYGKFALVENFWETGYGMPSFTLLGAQVVRMPFIITSSYPHEILHNWWGNSVFVDYDSGNWCEGLTAYMADHLIQEQRGAGAEYRRSTLQKYRDYVREGRDFPLVEFRNRHSAATEAVGYGKSLMMFHMLRLRVGDDAFRTALADFFRKNRGSRAGFADIRASFESVTGEDLSAFFGQWVERSGAPSLVVRDVRVEGPAASGGAAYTVTGSIEQVQTDDPFSLAVPVVVATEKGQQSFVVQMDSRTAPFSLAVDAPPTALQVDPSFDVFRLLDPHETPASIGQIFGEPQVLAVLPSGEDAAPYRELIEGWRTDDHAVEFVRDSEIESLPADRAVWILGRSNRFAGGLLDFDRQVDPTRPIESLTLGQDRVSAQDQTIIVIRRNPQNAEKAIGWISVAPGAAFPGVGRKLPHYGKYSYLAFEGEEPTNTVKGQWEATDSPLVVEFVPGGSASIKPQAPPALAELPPVFSQRLLREHVEWLAAPDRRGRGLGTPELDEAADYIAKQFASAGLQPGGDDGGWFQRFTIPEGPDGKPVEARNVIGILPGSRADWSDQSVVLSAHYDHLGLGWPDVHAGDEGKIHPGADDNASGVSVLIELARNLASEGGGSRNLVFAAFTGEESGLQGSRYYVAHPRFPVSDIRGVINMDTVGRLNDGEIAVHATGTADEWQHIFRGVGFVTGIRSKNVPARVGGSDQDSFIDAGVPAVQLFTGANADYHRPSDTPDKIDDAGLVKVATFTKEALAYLLEREEPLTVRIDGAAAAPPGGEPHAAQGGRRVSFGTVPQFDFTGPGVKVESLVPDSPADRAGVHAGDVLVRLDGTSIADLRAFSEFLKTLEPGQEVVAVVLRDGSEVTIPVRVEAR